MATGVIAPLPLEFGLEIGMRLVWVCAASMFLLMPGTIGRSQAGTMPSKTFYVDAHGDDRDSGEAPERGARGTGGPLASLNRAREVVRAWRKGHPGVAVHIKVAPGQYPVRGPVVFSPEDSGTQDAPISYEGVPGTVYVRGENHVVGRPKLTNDGLWEISIVDDPARAQDQFEQIWVNGRRAPRAAIPDGYFIVQAAVRPGPHMSPERAERSFVSSKGDLPSDLDLRGIELDLYHSWSVSQHHVESYDPATGIVTLRSKPPEPFLKFGPQQRYRVSGDVKRASKPGTWWYDAHRRAVLYHPLPGESVESADVEIPWTEQLINIKGEPRHRVSDISFSGISFVYAQVFLSAKDHTFYQAAADIPGAVIVQYADRISFQRCEVAHVGTYGIWFRWGARASRVEQTYVHDTGAGGIRIGEVIAPKSPLDFTDTIAVENNILRGGGRLFPDAVGIWIGHSGQNSIVHNDVADYFYSGISVGWVWGYGPSVATGNRISFNRVHDIGWDVLSDMGGIYTLGPSGGTEISDNVVMRVKNHDGYGGGGFGIYCDEGSSGITIERNFVEDAHTGAFHIHYGKDIVVRNNVFAFNGDRGQIKITRAEPHREATFESNVVVWSGGPAFFGPVRGPQAVFQRNLYWGGDPRALLSNGVGFEGWRAPARDLDSVAAEPNFANLRDGLLTARSDSPIYKVGFHPFDTTKAGVYGDQAWRDRAAAPVSPPSNFIPKA